MQLGATYSDIWRRIWFLDKRVPTIRRACNEEQETSSKKHWVERNRQQAYLNTRIHQWRSHSKNPFWNFSGISEWSVSINLVKIPYQQSFLKAKAIPSNWFLQRRGFSDDTISDFLVTRKNEDSEFIPSARRKNGKWLVFWDCHILMNHIFIMNDKALVTLFISFCRCWAWARKTGL